MTGLFPELPSQFPARSRASARRQGFSGGRAAAEAARRRQEWPLEGKINVVLFAGMGGACQGMEEAGFPVHVAVNHDEIAIAAHKALNPHTHHLQADIYEVDPLLACRGRYVGNLWGSPDCFPAGTLVATGNGLRPIEAVHVGDMVLTHRGRWRAVTAAFNHRADTVSVRGYGHYGLVTTPGHQFYSKRITTRWPSEKGATGKRVGRRRTLVENPYWPVAKDMEGKLWATPRRFPASAMPQGAGVEMSESFFWFLGRWIGDGSLNKGDVEICCGLRESEAFAARMDANPLRDADGMPIPYRIVERSSTKMFVWGCAALGRWLEAEVGNFCDTKQLPWWCLSMQRGWRAAILNGYVSADGWRGPATSVSTVSKALAIGIRLLATSLDLSAALYLDAGGKVGEIEGRQFIERDRYSVKWREELQRETTFSDTLHTYMPVREVAPAGRQTVYALTVEEDESFVADGIVVHNCRDHSVAKGGAPRSPRVRSMPWQLCRWTGVLRKRGLGPDAVYLENVREIRGWGPLIAKRDKATGRVVKLDGTIAAKGERVPVREQQLVRDPKRIGRHYRAWVKHMRGLGATYEDRDMCCADYGVPTSRKRLFGVALFDGRQPVWPAITHAHRNSEAVKAGALLPHVPAASFINWNLPLPSIFDRKKPLAAATMKRVAIGMRRFVLEAEKPFLIHLTHQGARPAMDVDDAGATVTGAHRGEVALVAPYVAGVNNVSTRACRVFPTDDPLTTQCTVQGNALVGAVIQAAHGEGKPGGAQRWGHGSRDAAEPLGTNTASNAHAVMAATIIGAGGRAAQTQPIDVAGPLNASTTKEDRCVVAAHLVQTGYGEREGQAPRCLDIENSIGTQVAGGGKHAVCGAWMVQHNTGVVGHVPDDSLSTMTVAGTQQQVAGAFMIHQRGTGVATSPEESARTLATGGGKGGDHVGTCAAYLTEYYGTGGQHCAADEALNTLSTADRFAVTGGHVGHPPLSPDQIARARQVAEFLRAHGVWNGGDIVTFGAWIVVDIGMRMLRPEEAAAAHELTMPDLIRVKQRDRKGNVVLDAEGREVWNERPLTKTEAMRLVGNSVPKRMARLLLECNARASLAMEAAE